MKTLLTVTLAVIITSFAHAQSCTPGGDQTSFGTANTWIGYIYDNQDFSNYAGYINEGSAVSPDFNEPFGGDYINYSTNGCPVYTETFSARYKLTKTFAAGTYQFMVGADDGYRLSLDGGATWIINRWFDQGYAFTAYATTLSGTYNMVLEYYENGGGNRLSFSVANLCLGLEDQLQYGSNDTWRGYIYQGVNFDHYTGMVTEGSTGNPNFNQNFGGSNTMYNTSSCSVPTEQFSARYRLQKTFVAGNYTFTAGGDDGYRLSIDGGATWVINHWNDQGYNTSTCNTILTGGSYNLVLEYYENAGGNQLSFNVAGALLPVQLIQFNGKAAGKNIGLHWKVTNEVNTDYYLAERSINGIDFEVLGRIYAVNPVVATAADKTYGYTDQSPANGINYYRLRMVDNDGKFSYSPVIKIIPNEKKAVSIYPSVVNRTPVYLQTSSALANGLVDIFDMTGKKMQQIKLRSLSAGQTITLSLSTMHAGNYIAVCTEGNEVRAKQIIIVRQ
ncbi:MAG: PA14 domain-containing protein [Chitinophagaceae bacterium]